MKHTIQQLTFTLLLLALPAGALAAEIVPSITTEAVAEDGQCSLREAIQAANTDSPVDACPAGAGEDTIVLEAKQYLVTNGEFTISSPIVVKGKISEEKDVDGNTLQSAILRDTTAPAFRLFNVLAAAQLTLQDLIVANGDATNDRGGAIYTDGTLNLLRVNLRDNTAKRGGAINLASDTVVTVESSVIQHNTATYQGGGVNSENTKLRLLNSTIADNACFPTPPETTCSGAGLALEGPAPILVYRSSLRNNAAYGTNGYGGAIRNWSSGLTISHSAIYSNTSSYYAGGIRTEGSGVTTVVNSTVAKNTATNAGGGILSDGLTTLINTTVAANTAVSRSGISNTGGTFIVENSLIIGNKTNIESDDCRGAITTNGHNRIGKRYTSCQITSSNNDVSGDYIGGQGNTAPIAMASILGDFVSSDIPGDAHYPLLATGPTQPYTLFGMANAATCQNYQLCDDTEGCLYALQTDQLGSPRAAGSCDIGAIQLATCGNGELQADRGEACDDGNASDGDGCSATCAVEKTAPADGDSEDDDDGGDDEQGDDDESEADDTEAKKPTSDKISGIDVSAPKNPFGGNNSGWGTNTANTAGGSTAAPAEAPASAPVTDSGASGGGCSLILH